MESNVDGCLGCKVVGTRFVIVEVYHVGEDVVGTQGIVERAEIDTLEESADALNALSKIGGHGSLAISGYALMSDGYNYIRCLAA